MMSNGQGSYTYSVTQGGGLASVDMNDGTVTLDQVGVGNPLAGNTTVEITATPTVAGFPAVTYEFEVKSSQWARVKGLAKYNTNNTFTGTYPAAELCGAPAGAGQLTGKVDHYGTGKASSYFFSRRDFTRSPITDNGYYFNVNANTGVPAGGTPTKGGYFSRDINGAFNDEWGMLNNPSAIGTTDYPLSGFGVNVKFWTAESCDSNCQFIVNSRYGSVDYNLPPVTNLVVCR